eukprot:TRINITY_DN120869_c0_g1_i1.p1 TRINITY_DN120869_c0_g1~~TRINITY_DN120869_c0_g1_i1.p1  ORF type:complete len:503 (-),score=87.20 TRINITY_DN120869_c0_g1_i1:462-1970(-)
MGAGCLKNGSIKEVFIKPPEQRRAVARQPVGTATGAVPGAPLPASSSRCPAPTHASVPRHPSQHALQTKVGNALPSGPSSTSLPEVNPQEEQIEDPSAQEVPVFFASILSELAKHKDALGGLFHFRGQTPYIERKVTRHNLATSYTDYEYVYLTVLGFARLHSHCEEIVSKDNGECFTRNPGVQMLERVSGFTMHAERSGASHLLRTAPAALVEAFQLATHGAESAEAKHRRASAFFREAFDRTADPCLEGRVARLLEFIEKSASQRDACKGSATLPPWEDVSLRALPLKAEPMDIVGEHLRVFMAECTWNWSCSRSIGYEEAKAARMNAESADDFTRLYNAARFEEAMYARGVVADGMLRQWHAGGRTDAASGETYWLPYEPDVNEHIEKAWQRKHPQTEVRIGPKGWRFVIDFNAMVQRNAKSGQERRLHVTEVPSSSRPGRVSKEDLAKCIQHFIDLETLPPSPDPPAGEGQGLSPILGPLPSSECLDNATAPCHKLQL